MNRVNALGAAEIVRYVLEDRAAPIAEGRAVGSAIVHGPQGDVVRGLNYVRCVRNAS